MNNVKNIRRIVFRVLLSLTIIFVAVTAVIWIKNPLLITLPISVLYHDSLSSLVSMGGLFAYLDPKTRTLEYHDGTGVIALSHEACASSSADLFDCGQRAWHRGEFQASVDYFERLIEQDGQSEDHLFWLAMAYLRLGEASNCLDQLLAESGHHETELDHSRMCSLPLELYHHDKSPTRSAAHLWTQLLDDYGPNPLYQWLVNFTLMAADDFPEGVPERYALVEDSPFHSLFYGAARKEIEAKFTNLRFRDVAGQIGVDWSRAAGGPGAGRGIAVEDFNRDGCLDIVTASGFRATTYYENRCTELGQLTFVDRSVESGLAAFKAGHIVTAADYDNDGWIDLFFGRHFGSERGDFILLRNQGDGTFEDVTRSTGLIAADDERYFQTWASAWGDIDSDGDLDLFVANAHGYSTYFKRSWFHAVFSLDENARSMLFRNDDGHFVEVTDEYGVNAVTDGHFIIGAAFGDYDSDGKLDLAVTRFYAPSEVLLHNEGGRFQAVDVIDSHAFGFMTSFVDTNHDGRLDLFVGGLGVADSVTEQVVFQTGKDRYQTQSRVWLQKKAGNWEKDSGYFGEFPQSPMGVNFGDLNHDGALDWYLGTGGPEGWYVLPNQMLLGRPERGEGPGTDDVSMLYGFGTIQKGHGIVFADFDRDGDQDIYSSLGGFWPGDVWPNQLFLNESQTDNHWIKLRLQGCVANRNGLGSTIAVHTKNGNTESKVYYSHMDNKTGFGSAPYLADIGLGAADTIERIEVSWLGPGGPNRVSYHAPIDRLSILAENGNVFESREEAEKSCQ